MADDDDKKKRMPFIGADASSDSRPYRELTPERMRGDREIFGAGVKWDKKGYVIEPGLGSESNPSAQHFEARRVQTNLDRKMGKLSEKEFLEAMAAIRKSEEDKK